jgi:hypothetical protein
MKTAVLFFRTLTLKTKNSCELVRKIGQNAQIFVNKCAVAYRWKPYSACVLVICAGGKVAILPLRPKMPVSAHEDFYVSVDRGFAEL